MSEEVSNPPSTATLGPQVVPDKPIRVLLLDDREENLVLRSAILRQKGYSVVTSSSIEEAESKIQASTLPCWIIIWAQASLEPT